jgi:asparagine synthase (glutamine-hydrolysing)
MKIFNTQEKSCLYTDDFARQLEGVDSLDYLAGKYDEGEAHTLIDKLLYVDIHSYLPEDLLVKMDIATMANSLEARAPFLDHQFMECVAGIPADLKLKGSQSKFILKKAFCDLLPEAILNRKKMGFGVPVTRWFRNELRDYVYELLLDSRTVNRGYFKREGIKHLLDDHIAQRYDHSAKLWALLVLEIWFRVFIDGEGDFGSQPAQQ